MSFVPNLLSIPHVLNKVCLSWRAAESTLQREMKSDRPLAHEEYITTRFVLNLRVELQRATSCRAIENAFVADLAAAFPDLSDDATLPNIANGLGAYVSRHESRTEGATGGDLGLVIVRPNIERRWDDELRIGNYSRGLLAQAKLKSMRTSKWGRFTDKQRAVLPQRVEYLAILLYSFSGEGALERFRWQLCRGFRLEQATAWLRSDDFPSPVNSEAIIAGLGNGKLGTDDETIIERVVTPSESPCLILRIDWPPGGRPKPVIRLEAKQAQVQQVRVSMIG